MQQSSGQYGAAFNAGAPIGTLTNWNVSATADTKAFVASNTQGGTGRREGNLDWSGSTKQLVAWPLDDTMMPAGANTNWDFLGYLAPVSGIPGDPGPAIGGPVVTESVVMSIDWAASALVDWTTNFSGNGELLWLNSGDTSTPVPALDTTLPVAIPSKFCTLSLANFTDSAPVWVPFCTTKCTITFKANLYPFSSSCTGGFVNKVTGTKDWTAVVTMDDPDMNNLVGVVDLRQNEFVGLKIDFAIPNLPGVPPIILKWGLVKDFSNINVNVETGDMITYDVQIDMSVDTGPASGIVNSGCVFPTGNDGLGGVYQWWPTV